MYKTNHFMQKTIADKHDNFKPKSRFCSEQVIKIHNIIYYISSIYAILYRKVTVTTVLISYDLRVFSLPEPLVEKAKLYFLSILSIELRSVHVSCAVYRSLLPGRTLMRAEQDPDPRTCFLSSLSRTVSRSSKSPDICEIL